MENDSKTNNRSTALLIKSGFWYTLSGFLTRAIGFITIPIFTRILTNEQIGDFYVYATWQTVLVIICSIEVYNTINRARFDFPDNKQLDSYITSSLLLSTAITAVVFCAYLVFPGVFYRVLLLDHKYMLIMFMYLFFSPAFSMFQMKQYVMYKYKLNAGIAFCLVLMSSVLAVILAIHLENDRLFGRIFGQYVLYIITGMIFYIYFILKSFSVKMVYIKYALRIGMPLVFSYLGSAILLSSDSVVVKHMCLDIQVSYIAIVHSAAHIILMLVQMLNNAWAPWFYDKLKMGQTESIRKTFKAYVLIIVTVTFLVLLFAPEIVLLLGGKNYSEAVNLLPANILSGVFTVLTVQMVNLETYYKKPEYAAVITGVVAVVNILLNIVGVLLWDYRAVCYVTVICYVLSMLIHYHFTREMKIRELIKPGDLIQFIGLSLLLIPVSLLLYLNDTIRLLFIVGIFTLLFVIVIRKRRLIRETIMKFREKK